MLAPRGRCRLFCLPLLPTMDPISFPMSILSTLWISEMRSMIRERSVAARGAACVGLFVNVYALVRKASRESPCGRVVLEDSCAPDTMNFL